MKINVKINLSNLQIIVKLATATLSKLSQVRDEREIRFTQISVSTTHTISLTTSKIQIRPKPSQENLR